MTTYYVRPDGLDAHTGTGPAAADAWLTIGKALGASGIASGDTVYIAPGVYREAVTVAMTSAVAETKVIGDVAASQFSDLQGGDVIWTAYTTNDKTAPAASAVLNLNTRDYLTFQDIQFGGGDVSPMFTSAAGSTNITWRRCAMVAGRSGAIVTYVATVDIANSWLFDSCCVAYLGTTAFTFTLPTSGSADYDAEIIFQNCLFLGTSGNLCNVTASGALANKGGGVKFYNCTAWGGGSGLVTLSANVATSAGNQCEFYNSLLICGGSGVGLNANASGQIVEDYNYIIAATPRTNVSTGANSQSSGSNMVMPYALLFHLGQEQMWGQFPRPFFSPMSNSPLLGFGNDGSVGVQTQDAFGVPRPAGPGPTWANANKAIGYSERANTWVKETGTVRTGTNCIACVGPGAKDISLPVDPVSTTVSVYMRYDGTYAGTKPAMQVRNGEECGVTSATATVAGAANNWEQLTLNFTPARQGIVTIRFVSSDTNGGGKAFADDLSVA